MSSAATLAVIIPPSIPMILYAVMAETSVVQLFVAGIVPGIIGGFGLMGDGVLVRAPLQPAARGRVLVRARPDDRARGAVGVPAADHHPGRHLRRRGHGDRGRGARGRRGALRRARDLPRARPAPQLRKAVRRRRRADRDRDAAGRDQRAARHLPDRGAGAAGARPRGGASSRRTSGWCSRCSTSCSCCSACSCTRPRRSSWSCRS